MQEMTNKYIFAYALAYFKIIDKIGNFRWLPDKDTCLKEKAPAMTPH
jgi:hypothetical protein